MVISVDGELILSTGRTACFRGSWKRDEICLVEGLTLYWYGCTFGCMTDDNRDLNTLPFLRGLVHSLDSKGEGSSGYVSNAAELMGVLSEVSPLISVAFLARKNLDPQEDMVSVEVKVRLTLSRDELAAYQLIEDARNSGSALDRFLSAGMKAPDIDGDFVPPCLVSS